MKTVFIYLFALIFSYGLHAQDVQETEETINIHYATGLGKIEEVRAFANGPLDINELNFSKNTPLHMVCNGIHSGMENRQQICQTIISVLFRAGADLTARNNDEQTPLYHIVQLVVKGIVPLSSFEEVVQMGGDVTVVDGSGNTLLHSIFSERISNNRQQVVVVKEVIDYLLQKGVGIDATNRAGQTSLDLASEYSTVSVVSHLIENGANVAMAEISLHNAVRARSFEITHRLLEAGASVDRLDDQDRTPLHLATIDLDRHDRKVHLEIIFLLIQNGADIHAEDHNGWTPFLQMVQRVQTVQGGVEQYEIFMQFVEWWSIQPLESNPSTPATSGKAVDTPVDDALVNSNYYYSNDGYYVRVSISDGFTTE